MLAQLRVLRAALSAKMILLLEGRKISVGRSESNTLQLEDERLSRRHCLFESEGLCWILTDLNSENGTLVNGQRITSVTLRDGDRIVLGASEFEFKLQRNLEEAYGVDAELFKASTMLLGEDKCARCGRPAYTPEELKKPGLRRRTRAPLCRRCADSLMGKTIGGYRIEDKLADDRHAPVYRVAKAGENGPPLALKVLRKSEVPNDEVVSRFLREAEWRGRFDHPNIAAIHDAGETEELHFLVMEFVDGETVQDEVARRGPMEPPRARATALHVAAALRYLHGLGVVHRDIKPSNVMLTRSGLAKLIDLGSAKLFRDAAETDITRVGVGLGTLQFMSPEQAFDARSVDHRADIYSLGATFYFMLTGSYPYKVSSVVDVVARSHGGDWKPPSALRPQIPGAYDAVVRRMMNSDPEERYPDADALLLALTALNAAGGV
ncbi:MAG: protein kinase [Planctomycetes bacterium]|nr:protein kinase [Planctomycetota bacterium]